MARLYSITNQPLIIAHRGGITEHAENSIQAFRHVTDSGFSYIESDVHTTRDGIAVIHHDPEILIDGTLHPITGMTWQELRAFSGTDGIVPRVDDVLDAFPDVVFNLDAKSNEAITPLMAAIGKTASANRVCLASFHQQRINAMRHALPQAAFSLGVAGVARMMAGATLRWKNPQPSGLLPNISQGYQAIQIPETIAVPTNVGKKLVRKPLRILTPRLIDTAHRQGLAVHVWTINNPAHAARLIDMGVDGIITDIPQRMRDELQRHGYTVTSA